MRYPTPQSLVLSLLLALFAEGQAAQQAGTVERCRDPHEGLAPPAVPQEGGDVVSIHAEQAEMSQTGASTVEGRVVVTRGARTLAADSLTFYRQAEVAEALQGVRYWDGRLYLHAAEGEFDLGADQAWLTDAHYRMLVGRGQGNARSVQLTQAGTALIERGTYSTCDPGAEDWVLEARAINLDRDADLGVAEDVSVRFLGVPVFYTPWIDFTLSGARKSGFLPPSFGSSTRTGLDLTIPYYWNIAPERDATLGLRVTSKRGPLLVGEYRYLAGDGRGDLQVEYMPEDSRYGDSRGLARLRHQQSFGGNWWTQVDVAGVSDREYLSDLGTGLEITSTQFLERQAAVGVASELWSATARVQAFQTVDPDIVRVDRPYERLPQVALRAGTPRRQEGLAVTVRGEGVHFAHPERVQGSRLDLMPSASYTLRTPATFLIPRVEFRYTDYRLEDSDPGTPGDPRPPSSGDSVSRSLPLLSLDAGAALERDLEYGGRHFVQTLEPRAYYLYVPYRDQDDLPVFDTSIYSFSFYQLFRENRFSGADRVGDANQVTLALTSRLLASDHGNELGRVSLGTVQYFSDRQVQLPGEPADTSSSSDLVAEVAAMLGSAWHLRSSWQWDTAEGETDKLTVVARYRPRPTDLVNLSYRLLRDPTGELDSVDQTDLSFRWQLTPRWSVVGRWNYAVPEAQTIETFGGVEFETCCWGLRAVARHYLSGEDEEYSTGVFLQLELKGLGGFGGEAVRFLEERIPGYENYF